MLSLTTITPITPLTLSHERQQDFIPPKKPYSFLAMLDDILQFSAQTLVDNGRLSFWMPTSNDQDQEIGVPTHPYLDIVCVATQVFNKCPSSPFSPRLVQTPEHHTNKSPPPTGSRRLITYKRIPDSQVDPETVKRAKEEAEKTRKDLGRKVDDLNPFRKAYFEGFGTPSACGTPTPGTPSDGEN